MWRRFGSVSKCKWQPLGMCRGNRNGEPRGKAGGSYVGLLDTSGKRWGTVHSGLVLVKPLKKSFLKGLHFCWTCHGKRHALELRKFTETRSASLWFVRRCTRVRCKLKVILSGPERWTEWRRYMAPSTCIEFDGCGDVDSGGDERRYVMWTFSL